jgi:type I restriction enzyme S subunit
MSKYVQLGDIAKIYSGGTPSRTNPTYWGGNIPWVKTAQIQNSVISENSVDEWITEKGLKHSSAKMVPKGTILMAMYGQGKTRGQVAILGLDAAINQACAAIQVGKNTNRDFIFQQLLFRYNSIRALSNAGSQENLNAGLIQEIELPNPPLPEQTAIANLLSNWDAAIEKRERLIAAKEEWFSWLIKSLISDECNGWEHLRADNIFANVSDRCNADAELLSVTQDRGVIPRTMLEGRVMSPEGSTDSYKLIKEGDFAISLRSFQGGIEYSRYQGLISPAYTVLRPTLKIHNDFYMHFFKSYLFIEKYLNIAVIGIRDGKQISIPDFMTVKIPLPPFDQQKRIAAILNKARQEIDLLRKQLDAYRKQKRGLMQRLLTGVWQLKVGARHAVPLREEE